MQGWKAAHYCLLMTRDPTPTQVMFSKPLPDFSCRLNAFATAVTCQWLMGPCKVNQVELDDGRVGAVWTCPNWCNGCRLPAVD